ncbi:zinc finger CCCH domain-containing protein 34-like [Daucus carota subsp. sativus]|uniref:zinc finger CCCH domain-containing protein 34-like n=1 Tax=Daucus carota subsp. sativus TaxID=79200 RepID=UPI003082F022
MEGSSNQHSRNQPKVLCFGTINFSDYQGLEVPAGSNNTDSLSQEVQNSAMKDPVHGKKLNAEGGPMVLKDGEHGNQKYPIRPEVDNCFYFMYYGRCKFGLNCRYNHPYDQVAQYLTPEASLDETVVAPAFEFNIPGMAIQQGMNEYYPHYIYNGSSNYGFNGWFDQSEPSPMEGGFPLSGYVPMEDTMPSWSFGPTVNEIGQVDPYMYQAAPISPYSEWSGNHVSN